MDEEMRKPLPHGPSAVSRRINQAVSWLASLGLTPSDTVTIEVRGRRSGQLRSCVVTWVEHAGARYVVSLAGESDWVRNARAAAGRVVIRHRGRRPATLREVALADRAPVLKAYMGKRAFTRSPEQSARLYFGLPPGAPLEDIEAIAWRYPVFEIAYD